MLKIKICNILTLAFILLFTLFCGTSVYADDTSLGRTPEGVFPIKEKDVIMESEEIIVNLENNSVECIFVFNNTGKSKNVLMGFPGKLYNSRGEGLTQDVNLAINHFKTFVKEKELPITHEKVNQHKNSETPEALNYSEFFTFTVPFNEYEKVTVRNTYSFTPTYDSIGYIYSGYVLQTGAMWKGPIGSAKVTFKLGKIQPYQIEQLYPGGFAFEGNELVWERKNFEPKYDLSLLYNTYQYSEEFLNNTTFDLATEIKQKIDSYNKVKELAIQGEIEELLTLYNKAIADRNSVMSIYIKSYLPPDKVSDEISRLGEISIDNKGNCYFIGCDIIGPEASFIQLRVSHKSYGIEILDMQSDSSACELELAPGIEYSITCTLSDWMDRTEEKTLKYKVPEKAEVTSESQTQPSETDVMAVISDLEIIPESLSESAIKSTIESSSGPTSELVSEEIDEKVLSQKGNDLNIIVWLLLGVILVGLSVVLVLFRRNKDR